MLLDLPTCRAHLTKRGFLRGLSFHSSKAWSMLLGKYFSISLRLYDYTAAKILIINEISNYFMLTLLKDRVIEAQKIPAIGSLSYSRDFSIGNHQEWRNAQNSPQKVTK